jgi:hypothetical protein
MKKLINIFGLVIGLIVACAGFIVANRYASTLGLLGIQKMLFAAIASLPGIALVFIFDGDYQKNLQQLIKPVSKSTWIWRIVGTAISILGAALFIGNRTGEASTFPFAGTIISIIGVFIAFKNDTDAK